MLQKLDLITEKKYNQIAKKILFADYGENYEQHYFNR